MRIGLLSFVAPVGIALALVAPRPAPAQPPAATNQAPGRQQPRIIVIPYTKAGEDIRKRIDNDPGLRVAINVVKQGFDRRGAMTADFIAVMRVVERSQAQNIDQQTDFRTRILEESRADIYIELDLTSSPTPPYGNSYSLLLQAYLVANGLSLANTNASAMAAADVPVEKPLERAANQKLDEFLGTLQSRFDDMQVNGVPLQVEFTIEPRSKTRMNTRVNGKELSDVLEDWFTANTVQGAYRVATVTETRMVLDEVRIPVRDTTRNGIALSPTRYARMIAEYLDSLQLRTARTVSGGSINVRFQ